MDREDATDPAALIARALKKKFAKHVLMHSPDEPEPGARARSNSGWSPSASPPSRALVSTRIALI